MKRRFIASHRMNASSSRSHCIFCLEVSHADPISPDQYITAKLSLVDLAGSERVSLTGATGGVLKQSIGINKSLFVLRKVIKALSQAAMLHGNQRKEALQHIAYRDSTLTRLLKHSLGGNCITLMIACLVS